MQTQKTSIPTGQAAGRFLIEIDYHGLEILMNFTGKGLIEDHMVYGLGPFEARGVVGNWLSLQHSPVSRQAL